jgi:hypothetical protein
VPRTIIIPTAETAAEAKKIQRQPTFSAMSPPKRAANPDPPHEPMDQRLTAR